MLALYKTSLVTLWIYVNWPKAVTTKCINGERMKSFSFNIFGLMGLLNKILHMRLVSMV